MKEAYGDRGSARTESPILVLEEPKNDMRVNEADRGSSVEIEIAFPFNFRKDRHVFKSSKRISSRFERRSERFQRILGKKEDINKTPKKQCFRG